MDIVFLIHSMSILRHEGSKKKCKRRPKCIFSIPPRNFNSTYRHNKIGNYGITNCGQILEEKNLIIISQK